ncbi:MAG: cisplatin damage response ATP-dependent DNA ligase [Ahrensia sp.]|nr:cisplatin damage response ATP-dependent DNA ligase [Ahrensia sp.]
MKPFATLLDRLVLTPSRNAKLRLLVDYFEQVPDPDRGYGLAAITRDLDIVSVKPAMLRNLVHERMDEVLFKLSYDYVGDLAETIALVWDNDVTVTSTKDADSSPRDHNGAPLLLSEVVERLQRMGKSEALKQVSSWLDQLDASGRYALLKLITGGMRIGVTARLAKQALALFGQRHIDVDIVEIEELWHGLEIPYTDLFAWLEGDAQKPVQRAAAPFRPVMLANPLADGDMRKLDPSDYAAEWKWDGIRVQATCEAGTRRLYSRTGDDIGRSFPDLLEHMNFEGALDGELLVGRPGDKGIDIGSFSDLQQRLNRKTVSKKLLASHPVIVRVYDLLAEGETNLREADFCQRREALERFVPSLEPTRFDLSPLVDFESWDELASARENVPHPIIEGVMIKQWNSSYVPGRPKGPWFKWKKDPMLIDAVLMYAQRGHGKRSSFYSDYTFGVWTGEGSLVPVGKAYFGFTDDELKQIDKFVRDNTVERFGPVRSVRASKDFGLVLEIAFEGIQRSSRHKSGVAMRFPRISKLRWDKPPAEADTIETVEALLDPA